MTDEEYRSDNTEMEIVSFIIIECTRIFQNDNYQCSQWSNFCQNDDISVSVYGFTKTASLVSYGVFVSILNKKNDYVIIRLNYIFL